MDYSREYLVHYYEADSDRRLTLPSLMRYFEDIAILHSESLGLGLDYYENNSCGWMLMKWDVAIRKLPRFAEAVHVTTRVHAMKRFLADRVYELCASDGTILAEARSNWVFVDTARRRPIRIAEDQYGRFGVTTESEASFVAIADVEPLAEAGPLTEAERLVVPVRAVASDIDTNRHVNNVSYIEWALDSLPAEVLLARSPVSMRAHYRKELALGIEAAVHSVFVETASETAISRHSIRSGPDEFCSIEVNWGTQAKAL
jgi:medium-chain acyl-[acyl-carrier-protein] hydrolase